MSSAVQPILLGNRFIGSSFPCFIIAEAGVNHNGDMELARQLVEASAHAGADAVKFQTFRAEKVVTRSAPKAEYQKNATGIKQSQYEMIKALELSADAHRQLQKHCANYGITFLSSPFDEESADFLHQLGVPLLKVGSGELTNLPLLAHIAGSGRPMVVSTGMATLEEVATAVRVIEENGDPGIVLLQCVSNYPANPADINLRAMETMRRAFGVPIGYSDHVPHNSVSFAAVALGANLIEKHFTLDRSLPGPDHQASLEPAEFADLVRGVRAVEAALGDGRKRPSASEANARDVARRSLVAAIYLPSGTVLREEHFARKRPGLGLAPAMLPFLIGRRTSRALAEDELITMDALE